MSKKFTMTKVADILSEMLKRGLKHINYDHIELEMVDAYDEGIDVRDAEGSFAFRVYSDKIGIQIYTCGSKMPEIHAEDEFLFDDDDVGGSVPSFVYQAIAWFLGEYVKYNIEVLGPELLGELDEGVGDEDDEEGEL
jgi:hypothetical protein